MNSRQRKEVDIDKGYELYQIITDFGNPLEIFREAFQNSIDEGATEVYCKVYEKNSISGSELRIDIWDNGRGLSKDNVNCFFDLANSTKVDENYMPKKDKLGYKGHGAKIFFNSTEVIITSKIEGEEWSVKLDDPIGQIEREGTMYYSDFKKSTETGVEMPDSFEHGFFVRIIDHKHFKGSNTKFKLTHTNLRDYCNWYTVFGTILTEFDEKLKDKDIKLYLSGLDIDSFKNNYNTREKIDPIPNFKRINNEVFEIISLGHYFPDERSTEQAMKRYAKEIGSNKDYYRYYSRMVSRTKQSCSDGTQFDFILNIEGYETKRQYDILLTRRGRSRTDISHTDSERYGLWACKGGVPVERIDDWVEGGKGAYSYMQAFVDCDKF